MLAAKIPIVHCIPALHTLHTCKHASDSSDITPQVCIVTSNMSSCQIEMEIGGSMQYRVLISYNCNMLEAMYWSRCKLISKFTTDDCNVYMKQAIMELHLTLDSFLQQYSIIDVRCVLMCPSALY